MSPRTSSLAARSLPNPQTHLGGVGKLPIVPLTLLSNPCQISLVAATPSLQLLSTVALSAPMSAHSGLIRLMASLICPTIGAVKSPTHFRIGEMILLPNHSPIRYF